MINYADIVNTLVLNGYMFRVNLGNEQYFFDNEVVAAWYVTPHEESNNLHMIKAEAILEFDGWENAQYEVFFSTEDELKNVIKELNNINYLS